jgi:pyruvate dehydrogenase E1 component
VVSAAADHRPALWGGDADLWSCPRSPLPPRAGLAPARANLRDPAGERRRTHVERCLAETRGPVVAATDYVRAFAEQIRPYVPRRYVVLGTDGFGRSDTRERLRRFFEVDRHHVTVAALKTLADDGALPAEKVKEALERYRIDPRKPPPWTV